MPSLSHIAAVLIVVVFVCFLGRTWAEYRSRRNSPVLETGLRAIDLFMPIRIGGDVSASSHATIPAKRRRVAESACAAVKAAQANLYPGALSDSDWVFHRDEGKRVAPQALRFVSQPYFVAEPYTGQTAAYVSVLESVNSFQAILSG